MSKIPNLFNQNPLVISQGRHTQGWSNMSASVAIDFAYTGDMLSPFDGCEVILYPNSDQGQQSYFGLKLPDGSLIICVHCYPIRTGIFKKGEVVAKCRWHHYHLSIIVNGQLDCIMSYLDRSIPTMTQANLYGGDSNHLDCQFSNYPDKQLNFNNQNNNNMSDIEQQKQIARDFLENPNNQAMPFNDNNHYGNLRGIIDEPDQQNPAEALKRFGEQAIGAYNESTTYIKSLQDQRKDWLLKEQSFNVQILDLTKKIEELKKQVQNYIDNPVSTEKTIYLTDESVKIENEELKAQIVKLEKQIALLGNGKFSLDKLITGIVSGKNYLTNFSFVSFLTGLSAYLSSLTTVANPEIASGLTFATGTIAMILIFVKNKEAKSTKILPTKI